MNEALLSSKMESIVYLHFLGRSLSLTNSVKFMRNYVCNVVIATIINGMLTHATFFLTNWMQLPSFWKEDVSNNAFITIYAS